LTIACGDIEEVMSPNEKRFFVATCLLLVGVLGWEFYRQGGLQKVFFMS
jgi:hypothetical protein